MIPENTTCPVCIHIREGCDETCSSCTDCYVKTGDTKCDQKCEHAKHEDDGGFFIDGNHPDAMFG